MSDDRLSNLCTVSTERSLSAELMQNSSIVGIQFHSVGKQKVDCCFKCRCVILRVIAYEAEFYPKSFKFQLSVIVL